MSIKIMSKVWEHSAMKGSALLLLLAIADFADDDGAAFPGTETLAAKIRMSERQVIRLRQILYESGELQYISGGKFKGDKLSVRVTPRVSKGDKPGTLRVTPVSPDPPFLTVKEPPLLDDGGGDTISLADVNLAYENNIGLFTQIMGEKVADAYDEFGGQWILDAIAIACTQNVRKWAYIDGILRRWAVSGKGDKLKPTEETLDFTKEAEAIVWTR